MISTVSALAKRITTHMIGLRGEVNDDSMRTIGRIWITQIHESLLKGSHALDRFETIMIHPICMHHTFFALWQPLERNSKLLQSTHRTICRNQAQR